MRRIALLISLVALFSCQEENHPPTCAIINPSNNEVFNKGNMISISVDASDREGEVTEVRLFFNNMGLASLKSFPYNFDLETEEVSPGNYIIKATAVDEEGLESSDEIEISIIAVLPVVTTSAVSSISDSSAVSGGNITSDGGATVAARGVCWSTSPDPTLSDNFTIDGSGTGSFVSTITGLSCEMTYYVRAYATNSEGTSYGEQVTFSTTACPAVLPTVATAAITDITGESAQVGGDVTSDGGALVTSRGVCWSTSPDPTLSDNFTSDGSGTGIFVSAITGLSCEMTYYVRAYATNSEGTSYGSQVNFKTADCTTVTDYDGNIYNVIEIGSQVWMKENLKATHYANGSAIPHVESISGWNALDYNDKAYCWYDERSSNGDIYGNLYTWAAAMNGASGSDANPSGVQGICPNGWHIPSDSEWKELEMYLGMSQDEADKVSWRGTDEGGKLKETGTTYWASPNAGATNESGFTALPGGVRYDDGTFNYIRNYAIFWSASDGSGTSAWIRRLSNLYSVVGRSSNWYKTYGLSVRCVKDQ